MEFHEREFFISRICAGYIRYKIKADIILVIKFPNNDIKYQAQEKYNQTYESAVSDGVYNDKDIVNFLKEFNVWNDESEKYLTDTKVGLAHQIETFKIQLYQAAFKPSEQEKIRQYLAIAKKEFSRLSQIRYQYDYITCHGLATYSRWYYIIKNCTYCEDDNLYNWGDTSIQQVMTYYQSQVISDEKMRLIARTEPWYSKWSAMKLNGNAFGSNISYITDEQSQLLSWTGLYNNIAESPDCPPKSVVADDDMLDGWMILENQNREKEQSKKRNDDIINKNPKIANADEVFIMAETLEDAQNINKLNTAQSSMIKSMRLKQVAEQGTVAHKDFGDVRRDLAMKANKAYIQKMKEK